MRISWKKMMPVVLIGLVTLSACSKSGVGCGTSIDCTGITYSGTIKPLVATKCAISGCHTSYGTYSGLKNIADNGNLYSQVVSSENMPQGNINMSCEERAQIECWINGGAPNN